MMTTEVNAVAPWQWWEHRFTAMNTTVEVQVYGRNPTQPLAVEQLFREAEQRMSRFLSDSELSRFNATGDQPVTLSPELFDALEAALAAAWATDGLFDPTLLDDLVAAGYDRSFEHVVERAQFRWSAPVDLHDAPQVTRRRLFSYADIQLDRAGRRATKPAALRLDLGGMGKGWTVDRAAELLLGEGPFLVNAGGDLYAHGQPGDRRGWEITIEHPWRPEQWIARLFLDHMALATSTIMKRRWRRNGALHHHLIDPRSGRPANTDAASVTVVAPRTLLAEVFAKVALVLGAEAGIAFLEQTPDIDGLIYTTDGRLLHTTGLRDRIDALAPTGQSDAETSQ
ncbi:MAG TPA: FAD:protein FMN transferase [Chloroflexi bacterium]|nr:FAD:protein FMN transferase [Chloroflexota bacterium]